MSAATPFFHAFEYFILIYFAILVLIYALTGFFGLRSIIVYARELSPIALKDLVERKYYKPVSILVPAYNEEATIVSSVRSLLALNYPEFEVIVASDGSTDHTLELLIDAFRLVEDPRIRRRLVPTESVRRVLRSETDPHLRVVDKENGGRADAINAALNLATLPLVCVIDADSLLNPEALARVSRLFVEDESVVAVGGTIRPMNGAVVQDGAVIDVSAPRRWVERFQILEYARAFFISRAAWSRINSLLIISGAFGLFSREVAIAVGGWERGFVADDMEMVVKLHRHFREMKQRYRIVFTPDPICWTQVPSTFRALRAQRNGWHRGMLEVLWRHRRMLFNPRYGRMGMLGIPYLWIFEAGATVVECLGYIYIILALALGILNVPFLLMFLLLAVLYGVLLSELGMGIETLLLTRYSRYRDRAMLLIAAFVEYLGYHQVLVFVRTVAMFQVRRRHGKYWTEERQELEAGRAEERHAA